jgi:hypothetical protein
MEREQMRMAILRQEQTFRQQVRQATQHPEKIKKKHIQISELYKNFSPLCFYLNFSLFRFMSCTDCTMFRNS